MSTPNPEPIDDAKSALAAFQAAALSAAGGIALVGLVGVVLAGLIHDEALRRVVENVAAIIFAIGLVQVVSDAWLHSRLTSSFLGVVQRGQDKATTALTERFDELQHAIEIDQRLVPSGVRSVERTRTAWTELLSDADKVVLVPVDLGGGWQQEEWDAVLRCARNRRIDVDVFLPNVRGANADAHTLHFGHDGVHLEADLRGTQEALFAGWKDGSVTQGCKLQVFTYDRPAGYGLVIGNSGWAMILPPAGGPRSGSPRVVIAFKDGTDSGFLETARRQTDSLEATLQDDAEA